MAAAVLPPLLPTPPTSKMPALLPTPCLIILPASFRASTSSDPRPGRADSVERWDARKKAGGSVASSTSSRASSGSPGRADSCERWDAHKRPGSPASSTGSNGSPRRGRDDSVERWDSNKRPPSRASSAERWDINKKPRPEEDAPASGMSNSTRQTTKTSEAMISKPQIYSKTAKPPQSFSGPAFFSSPDPSMLPMPTFLLAR